MHHVLPDAQDIPVWIAYLVQPYLSMLNTVWTVKFITPIFYIQSVQSIDLCVKVCWPLCCLLLLLVEYSQSDITSHNSIQYSNLALVHNVYKRKRHASAWHKETCWKARNKQIAWMGSIYADFTPRTKPFTVSALLFHCNNIISLGNQGNSYLNIISSD